MCLTYCLGLLLRVVLVKLVVFGFLCCVVVYGLLFSYVFVFLTLLFVCVVILVLIGLGDDCSFIIVLLHSAAHFTLSYSWVD